MESDRVLYWAKEDGPDRQNAVINHKNDMREEE